MSKNGKILLIVGGVLLVAAVVCAGAAKFGMDYAEKRITESTADDKAAGLELAKTADQQGCIVEGLNRASPVPFTDLGAAIGLRVFVGECLHNAKPVNDFCVGVPPLLSLKEGEWTTEQCRRSGMDEMKTGCKYVFTEKHSFCGALK